MSSLRRTVRPLAAAAMRSTSRLFTPVTAIAVAGPLLAGTLLVGPAAGPAQAGSAPASPMQSAQSKPVSAADNPVTPGDFTGYGFDQCLGPSQAAMDAWRLHSPFSAVGIYISGDSRGCRQQPNLTPTWVRTQLRKGWRLLPITLGPQASCHPDFPRYSDDKTINPRPGDAGRYPRARRQARAEANRAVGVASRLGIVKDSTLWYDLEGFDITNRHCRESAIAFVSSWTTRLHRLGYVSGVYSSAGSGIKMLDDARVNRPDKVVLPDRIWIARWDGIPNTSTDYIRDDGWRPGGRMKQYLGGHVETHGGVSINIDSNFLDLGKGSVATPEQHCGGVRVSFRRYSRLTPGTSRTAQVRALQCLLKERDRYSGRIHGRYDDATIAAVRAWQAANGFPQRDAWLQRHWVSLQAKSGGRPVLKFGAAGPDVRRLQRALNATKDAGLRPSGVFDGATTEALRSWQARTGLPRTGVITPEAWSRLRTGTR